MNKIYLTLIQNKVLGFVMVTIFMMVPHLVFGATLSNWTTSATLVEYFTKILDAVIKIGALVVVMLMVYSGFLFVVAQGNEQKLEEAKHSLLWVVVGSAIILGAWALTTVVINTVVDQVLP